MSKQVRVLSGKVTAIWGHAVLITPDGHTRALRVGDVLHPGDRIMTSQDGIVQVMDEPNQLVAQGDLLDNLDPPGAGIQSGGDGNLLPGLRVDRVVEAVSPISFAHDGAQERQAAALDSLTKQIIVVERAEPVAPVVPGSPTITITSPLAGDDVINAAEKGQPLTVSGKTTGVEDGQKVDVVINGVHYSATVTGNTWTTTVPAADVAKLTNGTTYPVTANVSDQAGNPAPQASHDVKVDTTAPTLTAQLDPSSDSGVQGDGKTNDKTPTISGKGDAGSTIEITVPGTGEKLTTTVKPDGTWSVTPTQPIAEGPITIPVKETSPSGNVTSTTVPVTIDTTAPTIAITSPLAGDDVINAAEKGQPLTVSGTTTGVEDGQKVDVVINGVHYSATVSNNAWTTTVPATDVAKLTNGTTYPVTANVSDQAGNAAPQASHDVKVDTTAPTLTAQLDPSSDSGVPGDGKTNDKTPTISGKGDAGSTIEVTMPGTGEKLTTTVKPDGTWSVTPTQPIAEGPITIPVKETSPSGNVTSTTVPVTIDTTAPTITITSPLAGDDVINAAEKGQPLTISGTTTGVEDGQKVDVVINGVHYSATVSNNAWTTTVPAADVAKLTNGTTYPVTANVSDQAGNPAPQASHDVKVDTTAPTLTAQLDPSSDSGVPGDGKTNDKTPTISGKGDAGSTIEVTVPGTGEKLTTTVKPDGTWSVTPTQPLPDGPITIPVKETSPSGNVTSTTVPVTIDTTAPTIAINNPLAGDNIINATEKGQPLVISGTTTGVEDGQKADIAINGVHYSATVTNNTWTTTVPVADVGKLTNGLTYVVIANVSDQAGNPATQASRDVKVDTTAPTLTAQLDPSSDSGVPGDSKTNVKTPTISGKGDAGSTIEVTMPGTGEKLTTTVKPDGTWSVTPTQPIAEGPITIPVKETSPSGNVTSTTVPVTIDTTAPTIAINNPLAGDNIINATEKGQPLVISGTTTGVEDGQKADIAINGVHYSATVSNNTWTTTVPVADVGKLTNGLTYVVIANVSDQAGNPATQASRDVKVDATGPTLTAQLDPSSDSGVQGDSKTNDKTPTISGKGDAGSIIEITMPVTGEKLTTTVKSDGTWSVTPNQSLPDGTVTVPVKETNAVGNVSTANVPVTIDTTAPTIAIAAHLAGDDVINAAERGQPLTLNGTTTGVEDGQKVDVTLNGVHYSATVAGNTWSTTVPAADVGKLTNAVTYVVTANVSDQAGNPAPQATHDLAVDAGPHGNNVGLTTLEDVAVTFKVADFAFTGGSGALTAIRVDSLPIHGSLTLNGAAVATGAVISAADIAAGKLVFTPEANAPGADNLKGTGYSNFSFSVEDSQGLFDTSPKVATIDVTPVADKPILTVTNLAAEDFRTTWESAPNNDKSSSDAVTSTTLEGWTRLDVHTGTNVDPLPGGLNSFEIWNASTDSMQNSAGTYLRFSASPGGGNQFLELNNSSDNTLRQTLGIERTVQTVSGEVYTLTFDYAGRMGYSTGYTAIKVMVDGIVQQDYSATSPSNQLDWRTLTFSFAGDGKAHVISIETDATVYDKNGRGAMIDNIVLSHDQGVVAGNAADGGTDIQLGKYVSASLADTDGSEKLSLTFTGLPTGAQIIFASGSVAVVNNTATISGADLASAKLHLGADYFGSLQLGVTATSTETGNGSTNATATQTLNLTVSPQTGSTVDPSLKVLGDNGNDWLVGTGNQQTLAGGAGNDTLTGGGVGDVFRWTLGDQGTAGQPAADTITNFNTASAANGGAVLDLRDLLQGELGGANNAVGNLTNYLHFSVSGSNTVVSISTSGQFNGTNSAQVANETITLNGVNLQTLYGHTTDSLLTQDLLKNGKLLVDHS